MKRTSIWLVCGAVVALLASTASASLLIYEPFDYSPPGTPIAGLTNTYSPGNPTWNSAGTPTPPVHQITSPGLTAPSGLSAAIGNAGDMRKTDLTEYNRLNLPSQFGAGSTLYYSLLVNVPDIAGLATPHTNNNANNDVFIAFNNSTGASAARPNLWAGALTIRQGAAAGTYNLGVRSSTTAANTTYWSGDLNPAETLFVVVRYESGPTAGDGLGLSSLWINPSSATFRAASAPAPDGSTVGSTNLNGALDHVDSLIIGAGISNTATLGNPNQTYIDEIRVGTRWADVTIPEPASLALLLAGCALVLCPGRMARRL